MDDVAGPDLLRAAAAQAIDMGAPSLGLASAQRASELRQRDPVLLDLRAIAAFETAHYDEAASSAQRSIEVAGTVPARAYVLVESLRRSGDPAAGAEHARRSLDVFPGDPGLAVALGECLLALDRSEEAAAVTGEAIERHPNVWELHELRSRAAERLGDSAGRIDHERRVFELRGGDREIALRLGRSLFEADRDAEAHAVLVDALARDPDSRPLRLALIRSTEPPRWMGIALKVLPFVLAVAVALVVAGPPGTTAPERRPGTPQPGVIGFLVGCALSVAVTRGWMRRRAGAHYQAVREAQRGLGPEMVQAIGRRWKYVLLAGTIAALWATVLAVLYSELLGWGAAVVWIGVFATVMGVLSLAGWISGWLRRRAPTRNPFSALPLDPSRCRCEEFVLLGGSDADGYLRAHLAWNGEKLGDDARKVVCPATGFNWIVMSFTLEQLDGPPTLLRLLQQVDPDRAGVYL